MLIGAYFYQKIEKIKQNNRLTQEIQNAENAISTRVHDDIANNIYQIISSLENSDSKSSEDLKLLDNLDDVYQLSRNLSRENRSIDLDSDYKEELLNLIAVYKNSELRIVTVGLDEIDWKKFKKETKIQFYKILQEFLINMKKHSFADLVVLKFNVENKRFNFFYKDNGVELTDNQMFAKNGIQITENRIEKIGGQISFASEPNQGFGINLSIPI